MRTKDRLFQILKDKKPHAYKDLAYEIYGLDLRNLKSKIACISQAWHALKNDGVDIVSYFKNGQTHIELIHSDLEIAPETVYTFGAASINGIKVHDVPPLSQETLESSYEFILEANLMRAIQDICSHKVRTEREFLDRKIEELEEKLASLERENVELKANGSLLSRIFKG